MQTYRIKRKIDIRDLIFYIVLIAFPFLNFCVFYVGVGFNSILLTFRTYEYQGAELIQGWTLLGNLTTALKLLFTDYTHLTALKNSLIVWVIGYAFNTGLALLFSYYIFKKMAGARFFRVMLFLPSIISVIALVLIYKYCTDRAIPEIINSIFGTNIKGLIENEKTTFGTVIFYNILMGFGTNTLMYSNAMNGIEPEVIEAGKIDGAVGGKEFFYIVFPMIFSTYITFTIISVGSIFINQANMFSFFGHGASIEIMTMGYYLYEKTSAAGLDLTPYPVLAATGVLLTLVSIPVTYLIKWALEKYGPKM